MYRFHRVSVCVRPRFAYVCVCIYFVSYLCSIYCFIVVSSAADYLCYMYIYIYMCVCVCVSNIIIRYYTYIYLKVYAQQYKPTVHNNNNKTYIYIHIIFRNIPTIAWPHVRAHYIYWKISIYCIYIIYNNMYLRY
jgi:hypothetical protein